MHFRFDWFLFALAMHVTMCLLVGLLYGAMLPMLPTRPILLGGVIGPLLWTGLLYRILDFVNPLLDQQINWYLVCGLAGRVRSRCRTRGRAPEQSVDVGEPAARHARGHRSAGPHA